MDYKFSWLVETHEGVFQADADECAYGEHGGLSFWAGEERGGYLVTAFPGGAWLSVNIMSQMTGFQNGRDFLGPHKPPVKAK